MDLVNGLKKNIEYGGNMKKKLTEKMEKLETKMMTAGTILTVISSIGLYAFAFGIKTVHPMIYVMGMIMGTGWFCTACIDKIRRSK